MEKLAIKLRMDDLETEADLNGEYILISGYFINCPEMSNPKTAVFYGSIITALLPQAVSLVFMVLLPLFVLLMKIGWFSVVALVLSSAGPRSTYLHSKIWIDRVAGGVMGLLGIKLFISADIIN